MKADTRFKNYKQNITVAYPFKIVDASLSVTEGQWK